MSERLAAHLRAQIPTEDLLARQAVAFFLAYLEEGAEHDSTPLACRLERAAARLLPDSPLRAELIALEARLPEAPTKRENL
jgi:hypothetical protein